MLPALVALSLVLTRPSAAANPDEVPTDLRTVSRVEIHGVKQVPKRELWAALKTRRPSRFPTASRRRCRS